MRTTETVRLRGVSKSFGGMKAVDEVTLDIPAGTIMSLLGPSGCGKTTTLRMVAGLIRPDEGEIWVGDRLLSSSARVVRPEQRGISMIFQSYALWPHMTVFDNVAYGVKLKSALRTDVKRRVAAMLDLVRMAGLGDRYPGELSGGQQQRVALARALAVEPTVLLMDEPLSNLDASLREEMRFEVRRLHDEIGITTVYVTHDLAEAIVVSDRIAVMNQGHVEQVGTAEDIYERPISRFVAKFMGQTSFLKATLVSPDCVRLGDQGPVIRVSSERTIPTGPLLIAVRPHDLVMSRDSADVDGGDNLLGGVVVGQAYLGDFRDYTVRLDGLGAEVRVVAKSAERFAEGERVVLRLPSSKCRVLPV